MHTTLLHQVQHVSTMVLAYVYGNVTKKTFTTLSSILSTTKAIFAACFASAKFSHEFTLENTSFSNSLRSLFRITFSPQTICPIIEKPYLRYFGNPELYCLYNFGFLFGISIYTLRVSLFFLWRYPYFPDH